MSYFKWRKAHLYSAQKMEADGAFRPYFTFILSFILDVTGEL